MAYGGTEKSVKVIDRNGGYKELKEEQKNKIICKRKRKLKLQLEYNC